MLTVTIAQSEGVSGADLPEQAVKKMCTGSAALSLPSPRSFFAFLITERLSTTISEPGTVEQAIVDCALFHTFLSVKECTYKYTEFQGCSLFLITCSCKR